jgi:Ca2+-binding RTX toxin-like protein
MSSNSEITPDYSSFDAWETNLNQSALLEAENFFDSFVSETNAIANKLKAKASDRLPDALLDSDSDTTAARLAIGQADNSQDNFDDVAFNPNQEAWIKDIENIKSEAETSQNALSSSTIAQNNSTVPAAANLIVPPEVAMYAPEAIIDDNLPSDDKPGALIDTSEDGGVWGTPFGSGPTKITYSFKGDGNGVVAMNGDQQLWTKEALKTWEAVANIVFVYDPSGNGQISFGTKDLGPMAAGRKNGKVGNKVDLWLNNNSTIISNHPDYLNPTRGSDAFETLIHEIGHGLGLKHPGNYNAGGGGAPAPYLDPKNDNSHNTIMSYNGNGGGTKYGGTDADPETPMLYDMISIAHLYGINPNYNSGDNYYSWNTNDAFFATLWDMGGTDWISGGTQANRVEINLNPGSYSSIGQRSDTNTSPAGGNLGIGFAWVEGFYSYTWIENAIGSKNNDILEGNILSNKLYGREGDDFIFGYAGSVLDHTYSDGKDSLYGGAGKDVLRGNTDDDSLYGGADDDYLEGGTGNDYLSDNDNENAAGDDASDDHMIGGADKDTLVGGGGNDTLFGDDARNDGSINSNPGGDNLHGGLGNDLVYGEAGDDTLTGEDGNDTLLGSFGNDLLIGALGNDSLRGGSDNDILLDAAGNDTLDGGNGSDTLYGGDDGDTLIGGTIESKLDGSNLLYGEGGNDFLMGGRGASDTLYGGAGNDTLQAGIGKAWLDGGVGDDTANFSTSAIGVSVNLVAGNSTRGALIDKLISIEAVLGSNLNDTLSGSSKQDSLYGSSGNDSLIGENGDDRLEGGLGNDYLNGGNEAGTDTSSQDIVFGDSGDDTVWGGNGNDALDGGADNDFVGGWYGNDILTASLGNDTLNGGSGNDTVRADGGVDFILTNDKLTGLGIDTLVSIEEAMLTGSDGGNIFNASGFAGKARLSGKGGSDTLLGGNGNDMLDGGSGGDILKGGGGNDSYYVDSIADVVTETSTIATEVDTVYASSIDFSFGYTLGANVENLFIGGKVTTGVGNNLNNLIGGSKTAPVNKLYGGAGNDTLIGGDGSDFLDGGTGNDTLRGGKGADVYFVDSIGDVVTEPDATLPPTEFAASAVAIVPPQSDRVSASISYGLGLGLEELVLTGTANINGSGNSSSNALSGNNANNTLSGAGGKDTLRGAGGNDILTGGADGDSFLYATGVAFTKSSVGIDTITDFTSGTDKITLSATTFSAGTTFASVINDALAASSSAFITYSQSTGHLFYNQNAAATGFETATGLGGQFATLAGLPELKATDFVLQA